MSGQLTQAQKDWIHAVLGLDADADAPDDAGQDSQAAVNGANGHAAAKPAANGNGAPEEASGGPGGGGPTATIKTALGDFVYPAAAAPKVESAMQDIANGFAAIWSEDERLTPLLMKLENLQEKYNNTNPDDIRQEITSKSDRTLKDEAGAARGSDVVNKGFKNFVEDLVNRLDDAAKAFKFAQDDLSVQNMHDQSADMARIGKELQQGPFRELLDGINKVKGIAGQVAGLIEDPADPLAWMQAANDLFELFQQNNSFLTKAAELETQATKLHLTTLEAKVKAARGTLGTLKSEVVKWQPVVAQAQKDQKTKVATRDHYYDGKKGGTFRFGDAREGIDSCKEAHDLAYQVVGEAHQVKSRIEALMKANGDDHAKWMAKPADGMKILNRMSSEAQDIYRRYEPKVKWATELGKAFEKLYGDAGDALADAPDK